MKSVYLRFSYILTYIKYIPMQSSSTVEETSVSSPSPVENGHSSSDSNLKPEAEQTPTENQPDTGENSTSNTSTERHPQESSGNKEISCSDCRAEHSKQSAEEIVDEHTEATEDECPAESAENGTNGKQETECCEGMISWSNTSNKIAATCNKI